jgi:hypothetical protein
MTPEESRKQLFEQEKARADKSKAASKERLSKGRPTPTQDENDRAALGEHFTNHEDDGSGPDVNMPEHPDHPLHAEYKQRQSTASGGAAYQTKTATPKST